MHGPSLASLSLALICACGLAPQTRAGGVDNRNNNSADYIRSLSRNAATRGGDAAIYNPAGTVRLQDGFLVSLHNQTIARIARHELSVPAAAFKSDIISLLYPTGFAVYTHRGWAGFAGFSYPGGGGDLDYRRGSATVYPIQAALSAGDPSRNADVFLRSLYYGATLGGALALGNRISVALAGRFLYARNEITVDAVDPASPRDKANLIDHREDARGLGGILGADLFPGPGVVLALRLESPTRLSWKVRRSRLDLDSALRDPALRTGYTAGLRRSLRAPGTAFRRDLPMNLGLGAGTDLFSDLRADLSYNYYFNSLADWGGQEDLHRDGWEAALSLEYAWPIPLRTSAGAQYTVTGAGPKAYQLENPALDSYTLGTGLKYDFSTRLAVEAAFAANFGLDDRAAVPALRTTAEVEKRNYVSAVALEFRFF